MLDVEEVESDGDPADRRSKKVGSQATCARKWSAEVMTIVKEKEKRKRKRELVNEGRCCD